MSRIGRLPIEIKEGVKIEITGQLIKVAGPKGELSYTYNPLLKVEKTDSEINVSIAEETNLSRQLFGLTRTLINNMVLGVSEGFEKKLSIHGVGYRASAEGGKLTLNVGFSHPVEMIVPEGLEAKMEKNVIVISGIDKEKVGQFSADIRSIKKPEPYKGKGIRYIDEKVRRKAGKAAKA